MANKGQRNLLYTAIFICVLVGCALVFGLLKFCSTKTVMFSLVNESGIKFIADDDYMFSCDGSKITCCAEIVLNEKSGNSKSSSCRIEFFY